MTRTLLVAFTVVAGLLGGADARGPAIAAVPRLVVGPPIEQAAAQKSTYAYEVDLRAGDLLDLTATQDQVIVKFTLIEPDGSTSHRFDLPQIHPLSDRLIFVAEVTGVHRLEVYVDGVNTRAVPPHEGQLAFTITVDALRPAVPADVERARIARVSAKAGELVGQQKLAAIEEAIPLYIEAANGWRGLGEPRLEGATLRSLGYITAFFTQFRASSAEAWRRQTEIWRELGEVELEWESWRGLNVEYADDGQSSRARDAGREALRLSIGLLDRGRYGTDLRRVAFDELLLGNYEESRRLAGQALDVGIAIGDVTVEALALDILARLQAESGDMVAALLQQQRALALVGDSRIRRQLLMPLGFYQLSLGELDAADKTLGEGLALATRLVQREWDALMRIGLGDVATKRGDRVKARAQYDEARTILVKSGFPVYRCTLETRAGRLSLDDGDVDAARARFDEALSLAVKLGFAPCEVESRTGLADIALAGGRLDAARAHALRVIELVDGFREASASVDARTFGFASFAPAYERAVDVAMRLAASTGGDGRIVEALSLHERALARGLLDGLTAERLAQRARVPVALEAGRRQLRETWRSRVVEHETSMQRNNAARTATLAAEIAELTARLRDVEARIDAIDPRHASFIRPPALDLDALRALLDEETLLLEYGLGDARSYVWAVDVTGVRAFTLAPRAVIEAAARRAHEHLARAPESNTSVERETSQGAALRDLARLILEPVAPLLTKSRLVIVAPGALALVPFGALPALSEVEGPVLSGVEGPVLSGVEGPVLSGVEGPALSDGSNVPLLAAHEIISLPSATVLATLRTLDARRARRSKTAAVFADPVYELDDPRLSVRPATASTSGARSTSPADGAETPRGWSAAGSGQRGVSLKRLPFSRREAAAIQRYAPMPALSLVGLDATRERAMSKDLADYRIVHFAAHGLVQTDVPNLSGIALSLHDRQRRTRNGFLMLPDVYDMTLNADLVVLSACQTALGNEIRGEGVVGLPRGFMYAGASRVISSLWRVDDEATAVLMEAFYRRLLRDRLTAAAALRAAQLEVRRSPRWHEPFFWAAFVIQGDWR